MSLIKVMKTLSGDEVIGMFMTIDSDKGVLSVEYPFLIHTEIDTTTRTTYTDLQPYMFGADLSGPFHIAAHNVAVMPMKPKAHLIERYQNVVETISQQYEAAAQAERISNTAPVKVGNTLGKK